LIPLFAQYGSYKDYFSLIKGCQHSSYDPLVAAIVDFIVTRLRADEKIIDSTSASSDAAEIPSISLCAKYSPKEGKSFANGESKKVFKLLVHTLFPGDPNALFSYRKLLRKLNTVLDVVET